MQIPLEVTFRGMAPSPSVELAIGHWLSRLEHVCARIQRCSVRIELPHRRQRHGAQFQVHLALTVPGREISVAHDPGRGTSHEDVYLALADAFLAARRQLLDHAQIRRGDIKRHVA